MKSFIDDNSTFSMIQEINVYDNKKGKIDISSYENMNNLLASGKNINSDTSLKGIKYMISKDLWLKPKDIELTSVDGSDGCMLTFTVGASSDYIGKDYNLTIEVYALVFSLN